MSRLSSFWRPDWQAILIILATFGELGSLQDTRTRLAENPLAVLFHTSRFFIAAGFLLLSLDQQASRSDQDQMISQKSIKALYFADLAFNIAALAFGSSLVTSHAISGLVVDLFGLALKSHESHQTQTQRLAPAQ